MIRLATRADLNIVTDLLLEFLAETSYTTHCAEPDAEHIKRLVFSVLHQGYIWILFDQDTPQGVLVAVKEASVWMPQLISLRELVWYVRKSHRGTVAAGRMFVKFCQQGDKMLESGEIAGYFTTRMTTTVDYDLERRGFRQTEKLYIKEK
jgi:hypothetical protein